MGGAEGKGTAKDDLSGITNALAAPKEFGGTGEGTNPEELLAMAVASCYSITFGIIAKNRKLPFESIATSAVGEVEQNGAAFTYKKITIKPVITLTGADEAQLKVAEDMSHKADLYCIITNAVRDKVAIEVQPTIVNN